MNMKKFLFLNPIVFLMFFLLFGCFGLKKSPEDFLIIQNKGSDTLVNLAQVWAENYGRINSKVAISVSGGGSGTGIAALINNQVDIANSSRSIKEEESKKAEQNSGKKVTEYVVALDALSVFVHPSNPLQGLSRTELACIFGSEGNCDNWSQIRNTVVPGCKNNKIIRVSRMSNSGTYQYFLERVIGKKKDMRLGSMDLNGSKESIDLVQNTPCAIGYTGMGYINDHIKALCVTWDEGGPCIPPTLENAMNKTYPITRELFMYTLGEAEGEVKKYLEWIKGIDATKLVIKMGYIPSPAYWSIEDVNRLKAQTQGQKL
ncbi:MAG: phosphate ABC transporter substrate-binding protein [Bacteriovoracaceae bacterium]|nr:phosphate ABC transporter substrate-binding protein [Bacteriovoracaceae bacterium]